MTTEEFQTLEKSYRLLDNLTDKAQEDQLGKRLNIAFDEMSALVRFIRKNRKSIIKKPPKQKEFWLNKTLVCYYEIQRFEYKGANLFIHMLTDRIDEEAVANCIGIIEATDIESISYLNINATGE